MIRRFFSKAAVSQAASLHTKAVFRATDHLQSASSRSRKFSEIVKDSGTISENLKPILNKNASTSATDRGNIGITASSPYSVQSVKLKPIRKTPLDKLPEPTTLNKEQLEVWRGVVKGRSTCYIYGEAGTGKTYLLKTIIESLQNVHSRPGVAVTAMTGTAGVAISGSTLHSWAGLGLGRHSVSEMMERIRPAQQKRMIRADVLVVDEVSMMSGDLLEKLDEFLRIVRGRDEFFGGLQVIFSGDFFQLPPTATNSETSIRYAFESSLWKTHVQGNRYKLSEPMRQTDSSLQGILADVRVGKVSPETEDSIMQLSRPLSSASQETIVLCSLRSSASEINGKRLEQLPGELYTFHARDRYLLNQDVSIGENERDDFFRKRCQAPQVLQLKQGAKVMLLVNSTEDGLANGSIGTVVDFMRADFAQKARIPFLSGVWRTRQADGSSNPEELCVIVDFSTSTKSSNKIGSRKFAVCATTFTIETRVRSRLLDSESFVCSFRDQVPLVLSYAMTIHKSQGKTLPSVSVMMTDLFSVGQAYVALSRATSTSTLQVTGFDPAQVIADNRVITWHDSLLLGSNPKPQAVAQ